MLSLKFSNEWQAARNARGGINCKRKKLKFVSFTSSSARTILPTHLAYGIILNAHQPITFLCLIFIRMFLCVDFFNSIMCEKVSHSSPSPSLPPFVALFSPFYPFSFLHFAFTLPYDACQIPH